MDVRSLKIGGVCGQLFKSKATELYKQLPSSVNLNIREKLFSQLFSIFSTDIKSVLTVRKYSISKLTMQTSRAVCTHGYDT